MANPAIFANFTVLITPNNGGTAYDATVNAYATSEVRITSATQANGVVTITTDVANQLVQGDQVQISNVDGLGVMPNQAEGFNSFDATNPAQFFIVQSTPSGTTFTYNDPNATGSTQGSTAPNGINGDVFSPNIPQEWVITPGVNGTTAVLAPRRGARWDHSPERSDQCAANDKL